MTYSDPVLSATGPAGTVSFAPAEPEAALTHPDQFIAGGLIVGDTDLVRQCLALLASDTAQVMVSARRWYTFTDDRDSVDDVAAALWAVSGRRTAGNTALVDRLDAALGEGDDDVP